MTLNAKIIATITPVVGVCVPDLLVLEAGETAPEEYCTFDYDTAAGLAGDDVCEETVAQVRVRYYAPLKASTVSRRRALRRAIAAVDDFSLPSEQNASDEIGQAYVYTFEALMDEDGADG